MKRAVFLVLNKYADWEGGYLSSQLNKDSEWMVKTASIAHEVTSIGGFTTKVDYQIEEIPNDIDLLVLIGGDAWQVEEVKLVELIQARLNSGKFVAAICGSVDYLARNGLLDGYKHTGNAQYLWRKYINYHNDVDYIDKQAVVDKNLVTANGTAALEFTNLVLKMIKFTSDEQVDKMTDLYELGFYNYCERYGDPFH